MQALYNTRDFYAEVWHKHQVEMNTIFHITLDEIQRLI